MSFNATVIHPRILKEFENRWYLIGYSEDHSCIRLLVLIGCMISFIEKENSLK